MRMFSFAHGDMLRFKTFPRKVYLDENKENKEVSLQFHATWFAYVALLPSNDVQKKQTHTNER